MVLSETAKSGLESGAWVDGYDYQNKDKNTLPLRKIGVCHFFVQCSKNHLIPHPVSGRSWTLS